MLLTNNQLMNLEALVALYREFSSKNQGLGFYLPVSNSITTETISKVVEDFQITEGDMIKNIIESILLRINFILELKDVSEEEKVSEEEYEDMETLSIEEMMDYLKIDPTKAAMHLRSHKCVVYENNEFIDFETGDEFIPTEDENSDWILGELCTKELNDDEN